jgi:alcohol dehydrogenase class IV
MNAAAGGRSLEVLARPGVAGSLPMVLDWWQAQRVLVVASPGTLRRTDARDWLAGRDPIFFQDVTPNPQLSTVLRGVELVDRVCPDVVVGIGGGSTMDVAKAMRLLPHGQRSAERALAGEFARLRTGPPPLVLVPTTAGSGSEVTSFATIYVGTRKHSLDHASVRADVALVDPLLTYTCPPELTATCTLDALAHAIESNWSLRSTAHSRVLALHALTRLAPALHAGLDDLSPECCSNLSLAATTAGLAIDLTRTTAGHACAYPTTARFGVPHGLACALHLVWLLPLTMSERVTQCRDPRGPEFVARRVGEIAELLGADTAESAGEALADLIRRAGRPSRLSEVGIREADLADIAEDALGSNRITNHPVALEYATVVDRLRERL